MSVMNPLEKAIDQMIDEEIVRMEAEISKKVMRKIAQTIAYTMQYPHDVNKWDQNMASEPVPSDTITRLFYLKMKKRVSDRRARCKLV